jgi:hypothetical protein
MRRGECRAWRAHSPCGCSPFCAEAQDLCHTFMAAYDTFHAWTMSLLCAPPSEQPAEWARVPPPPPFLRAPLFYYVYKNSASPRERFMRPTLRAAVRLMPREIAFLCLLQAHPRRCLRLLPTVHTGVISSPGAHSRLVANQNLPEYLELFLICPIKQHFKLLMVKLLLFHKRKSNLFKVDSELKRFVEKY